jgi:hypothetical protein
MSVYHLVDDDIYSECTSKSKKQVSFALFDYDFFVLLYFASLFHSVYCCKKTYSFVAGIKNRDRCLFHEFFRRK